MLGDARETGRRACTVHVVSVRSPRGVIFAVCQFSYLPSAFVSRVDIALCGNVWRQIVSSPDVLSARTLEDYDNIDDTRHTSAGEEEHGPQVPRQTPMVIISQRPSKDPC